MKPLAADLLIGIGSRADLFHDERREAYAAIQGRRSRMILRVRSREFRVWLAHRLWSEHHMTASSEALQKALRVLEARAVHEGKCFPLSVRFAQRSGEIWIDLCNDRGRAARVDAQGWEVVDRPPILFRRYPHQQPLSEPARGGDLGAIFGFLPVRDPASQVLLTSWILTVAISTIARPILVLHGPEGSGKTVAARLIRSLLDPSAVEVLTLPRNTQELAQVLDHHALPVFDNLGRLDAEEANLLCQAVTGGGISQRELYSDDEDMLRAFRRPIITTGIVVPTSAPDLLDRCLLIELTRIPAEDRREEATFWQAFEALRPQLLGALCDALSCTLQIAPTLRFSSLPRLADWCRYGAAAAEALGFGAAAFLEAVGANIERQREEAVESSPVGQAVRDLVAEMAKDGEWTGTAADLLDTMKNRVPESVLRSRAWPSTPHGLSRRLREAQAALEDVGVRVEFARAGHAGQRTIRLTRAPVASSETDGPTDAQRVVYPLLGIEVEYQPDGNTNGVRPMTAGVRREEEARRA